MIAFKLFKGNVIGAIHLLIWWRIKYVNLQNYYRKPHNFPNAGGVFLVLGFCNDLCFIQKPIRIGVDVNASELSSLQ